MQPLEQKTKTMREPHQFDPLILRQLLQITELLQQNGAC